MPVSRRFNIKNKSSDKTKESTRGIASALAMIGDFVLQQPREIKFHTRARGNSPDRLAVEASFVRGFAISQALPVKVGLCL